jgi:hypothetical protein
MQFKIEAATAGRVVLFLGAKTERDAMRTAVHLQLQHRPRAGREITVRRDEEVIAQWLASDETWVSTLRYATA